MSPSEVITIILVGTLAGMSAMSGRMVAILGAYVKVPGGKSARFMLAHLDVDEGVPNVTISVGLALMDPHSLSISFADLLARAETELQRAKLGGRNRYCMREEVIQAPETPGANAGLALAIPN